MCVAAAASLGCEPELLVGDWGCFDVETSFNEEPVSLPFSTGFEDGFCDYAKAKGFCYSESGGTYTIVRSPVRGGSRAAAFTITTRGTPRSAGARCVIEGQFPSSGYYGAWYFIPEPVINEGNWNLLHFQGGEIRAPHYLWDVSVASGAGAESSFFLREFLRSPDRVHEATDPPAVPFGTWFHLEFYWKRANDTTGEVALFQDGEPVIELSGLRTDDSNWAQWYVGNLGNDLMPRVSTVYVDDVELRETP